MRRRILFEAEAFEDYNSWAKMDRKIYSEIVELLKDIERSPFSGIGKPEPLKYGLNGFWSRRISDEHRLIYQVTDAEILFKLLSR